MGKDGENDESNGVGRYEGSTRTQSYDRELVTTPRVPSYVLKQTNFILLLKIDPAYSSTNF
jgi:hypothetical protein